MQNAIALGTFDGVHPGHRAVLAQTAGYRCIAVTFRESPRSVMMGCSELLMTPEDKCHALRECGAADIYMLEFNDVRQMSPEDFLAMLQEKYRPGLISCGFNYRFGHKALGDVAFLRNFCAQNNITFCCKERVEADGHALSSSRIREQIKLGNVEKAKDYIWGGFGFSAPVLHGDKRGRTIGFPTINQQYPEELVRPKFGVYASLVFVDGKCCEGITNIGMRPTYTTKYVSAETFIPGFSGDLYGRSVTLKLQKFIREEQRFQSLELLKNAIDQDVSYLFGNAPNK